MVEGGIAAWEHDGPVEIGAGAKIAVGADDGAGLQPALAHVLHPPTPDVPREEPPQQQRLRGRMRRGAHGALLRARQSWESERGARGRAAVVYSPLGTVPRDCAIVGRQPCR